MVTNSPVKQQSNTNKLKHLLLSDTTNNSDSTKYRIYEVPTPYMAFNASVIGSSRTTNTIGCDI